MKLKEQVTFTNGDYVKLSESFNDVYDTTEYTVSTKVDGAEVEWKYFTKELAESKFNDYKVWLEDWNKSKSKVDTTKYCATCHSLLNENLECEECIENE
jgi:hypothetical protein